MHSVYGLFTWGPRFIARRIRIIRTRHTESESIDEKQFFYSRKTNKDHTYKISRSPGVIATEFTARVENTREKRQAFFAPFLESGALKYTTLQT